MNRSFGFRPNKSTGDAITALTSLRSQGLYMAIEGDIQGAYDNVPKKKMISQLSQKIDDKKFISLMTRRLNYDYVDESGRQPPCVGLPQGGTDSPLLWNIHLHDFDLFVHNQLKSEVERMNDRIPSKGVRYKPRQRAVSKINYLEKELDRTRERIKSGTVPLPEIRVLRERRFDLMGKIRSRRKKLLEMPYFDPNSRNIRIFFVRYADDWVLLSNANRQICEKFKSLIKDFLFNELGAVLSV